ncbi:MAG: hypothetical protein HRU15_17825, partial [Planctomycetes bacterium]|nr:hypothetical protein [Planctomycetota bacterium]
MQIQEFLGALRSRLRKSILLEGWSRVLVVLILTALAVFLLDCFAPLPGLLRLAFLLGYVFIVFDTVYWRLIKPLRLDMSDHNLVDLMERRLPELNGRAFVVLEGLPLVAADKEFLNTFLDDSAVRRIVPAPYMKQWFASCGGVCAVLALLMMLNGEFFTTAFERMLLPFGESEWDRSTKIVGKLEREVVAEDESVVFLFQRKFGRLDPLHVEWMNHDGREGSKTFDSIASPWRQALQLPPGKYSFSVRSGDSKAVRCSGHVVARPRLEEVHVRIEAPAYALQDTQDIDTFDVSVLPGSTLHFDIAIRMDQGRDLQDMALWYNDAAVELETTVATGEDKKNRIHGSLLVDKESSLLIMAGDQSGIGMKPVPKFHIGVLVDNAPQVRLSGPRRTEKVVVRAQVALRIDGSDDYGVASSKIFMRHELKESSAAADKKNDIEEHDVLQKIYTTKSLEITERHRLRIADYAAEGSRLVVSAQAQDANNVTGPGIGRSNDIELLVVSEQELRRDLQKRIAEVRERVQQSRDALMPALSNAEKVT